MSEGVIALAWRLAALLSLAVYVPWLVASDAFEGRMSLRDAAEIHWNTWLHIWKEGP